MSIASLQPRSPHSLQKPAAADCLRLRAALVAREQSGDLLQLGQTSTSTALVALAVATLLSVSGACGLVLQACWYREFSLFFGGTTAATAAVTAAFLGGLGIGNFVIGRRVDRAASPLLVYGLLELGVAATAAVTPWLIDLARQAFLVSGGSLVLGSVLASLVRLLLAAIVLGVPAFLMGGTLPAAVRAAMAQGDASRRTAAVFYGLNTLGGVVGVLLTTFVLVEAIGTRATLWLACVAGGTAGAAAVALALRSQPSGLAVSDANGDASAPVFPARAVGAAAFLSGFVFFALEMVWYRMLGPILGGTTFTFGLILAVALSGIAIGGIAYALLVRGRPTMQLLAATFLAEAVAVAVPFVIGDHLAILAAFLRESNSAGFAGLVAGWSVIAAMVVLPAALVAGFQFPLFAALLGAGRDRVGADIGAVFLFNTFGCIAGALAGGFGLLPLLTAPGAWRAAAITLAVTGAALAAMACVRLGRAATPRLGFAAAAVALVLGLVACDGPTAVWRHGGIGGGRAPRLSSMSANDREDWKRAVRRGVVWQVDGSEASLAIGSSNGYAFFINGRSDGHAIHDAGTQIMSGLLGAALHPHPRTALVVGLGTGETAGWLAEVSSIERVDVVEIEPAVVEMADRCAPVNHNVLQHPKVRFLPVDAREFLLTAGDRYDVVACEPSHPHRFGVASLFTAEFYATAAARLADDGLLVQFLPCYEVDRGTVGGMIASFSSRLPNVQLWETLPGDFCLVGGRRPIERTAADLAARLAEHPFPKALAAGWHVRGVDGFMSRYVGGRSLVAEAIRSCGGETATDDRNPIEFGAARVVGNPSLFDPAEMVDLGGKASADRDGMAAGVDPSRVAVARQWNLAVSGRCGKADAPGFPCRISDLVVRRFVAGDDAGMLEAWERAGAEARCLQEASWIARRYAEKGDERCRPLIEEIRSLMPAEALVLDSKFSLASGDRDGATARLAEAFTVLATDPWMSSGLRENAFQLATDLAAAPARAGTLLAALQKPFAADAARESRLTCGCFVAARLGAEAALPFVAAYEPHVPWKAMFLDFRKRVYAEAGDPRAALAALDVAEFERGQSAVPASSHVASKNEPSIESVR